MRGRAFLRAARQVVAGANEPCWRGGIVHAYYALFLECRDILASWGVPAPPRNQPHNWVRLKLQFAKDIEIKRLGDRLEVLLRTRNRASYDLNPHPEFSSSVLADQYIADVDASLAVLDAIEGDPVRRAAAIGSLPP